MGLSSYHVGLGVGLGPDKVTAGHFEVSQFGIWDSSDFKMDAISASFFSSTCDILFKASYAHLTKSHLFLGEASSWQQIPTTLSSGYGQNGVFEINTMGGKNNTIVSNNHGIPKLPEWPAPHSYTPS